MANILIKQGKEIAGSSLVNPSTKADKVDLTSIIQTGTTSTQAISAGTYFYLNDVLVKAKVDIANGATFTLNTNYEVVTAGALNNIINLLNNSYPKVKIKAGLTATVNTAGGYASVPFDLPTDMNTYIGSIFLCTGVSANWAFVSSQVDMHLYNGSMTDIRFAASVAQSYFGRVITYYI